MDVPSRALGRSSLTVPALGLGCMGMSFAYGPADADEAIATLHRALDLGVTFLDTSDLYGRGANEELIGTVIKGRRDEVLLATKFGIVSKPGGGAPRGFDGSPEYVKAACAASLRRLNVDHIDLYYNHRADPNVPIEDTVGAMAELVDAGKVRHLGLSEASAATIRRAAAVHPIAALQSEWSLFSRDIEAEIVPTCRELGIGLVPYSPLGRGLLTGALRNLDQLATEDLRRTMPRFQAGNLDHNLRLVDAVDEIATAKGCTPGQVALAWVLARGDDVVPIPGTRRRDHLEQNLGAFQVDLDREELARLDALDPAGPRYADLTFINRETVDRPT